MGIRGLTKFVYSLEDFLLQSYKLSDTTVIIDGNNLCSFLYELGRKSCKYNGVFGGDYDIMYTHFTEFFSRLLKCRINPIVLLDGCQPEYKLRTLRKRKERKLPTLVKLNRRQWCDDISPIFLFHVFVEVLVDMKIDHTQLYEEADREIAALAKYLNCPVVSDDSDFFIYDIDFIPLRKMGLTLRSKEEEASFFIECSLFRSEKLLEMFPGLEKPILPLVSVLMGNDFTAQNSWDPAKFGISDVAGAIQKLQTIRGPESFASEILPYSDESEVEKVEQIIRQTREYYDIPSPTSLPRLDADGRVTSDTMPVVYGRYLHDLPDKFLESFKKCKLCSFVLGLIRYGHYNLNIQVEDIKEKSAHFLSKPIIKDIYKILRSLTEASEDMKLIIRDGEKLLDDSFYCPYEDNISGRLTGNILNESEDVRLRVFCDSLGLTEIDRELLGKFDTEWTLFLISVMCWLRGTRKLSEIHLSAVLLMALCSYVKSIGRRERKDTSKANAFHTFSHLLQSVPVAEVTEFINEINPVINEKCIFKRKSFFREIHTFASLQSLMFHIHQLNSLLGEPFHEIRVSRFYSGTLLIKLFFVLKEENKCLEDVMKDLPNMLQAYTILKTLSSYLPAVGK